MHRMALLELLALSATAVGTYPALVGQAQPRQGVPKSSEVTLEVRESPKLRTLSYIMQTNPEGFADLLYAVRSRRADGAFLQGSFSRGELSRMTAVRSGGRSSVRVTAKGLGASRQRQTAGALGTLVKFDPDKLLTKDPLDFGMVLKGSPPPSLEASGTAYGEGTATWSLSGSKAFSVVLVKTSDWVSDASGNGFEKTVEHGGSKFPVTAGTQYRIVVRFDPKAAAGPQSGQLQIQEPNRTVLFPLKGDSFDKALGVTVKSFTPSSADIMPNETVEVSVNMDVTQNSGSQLVFKGTEKLTGIEVVGESQWVPKPGAVTQKLRIRTNDLAPDSASTPVTIGVYPVGSGSPLATFTVPLKIQRQWVEWNYTQSVGKQWIGGKMQVSNTGEYIWDLECYNSSSLFPDTFCAAFAMKGIPAKGGKNPGSFLALSLPITDVDRIFYREVGKFTTSDFQAIRGSKMAVYLGIEEGGPLGALGQFVQGMVDLMQATFTSDPYKQIPDNFPGAWMKWMIKNSFTKAEATNMKIWK